MFCNLLCFKHLSQKTDIEKRVFCDWVIDFWLKFFQKRTKVVCVFGNEWYNVIGKCNVIVISCHLLRDGSEREIQTYRL
jgi:hypothetical protein